MFPPAGNGLCVPRCDYEDGTLGLADDQHEGGGLDQESQSAGGGEGRRHADARDQSTENDEEPGEGEQSEEEAGREREPDEPAAHPLPPAATGDAGRSDEGRRQNELEDQTVQGGLTADGLHDVLVRKDVLWPSAEDDLTAVDRVEAVGDARRVHE